MNAESQKRKIRRFIRGAIKDDIIRFASTNGSNGATSRGGGKWRWNYHRTLHQDH